MSEHPDRTAWSALEPSARPPALKPVAQRHFETFLAIARQHGCDRDEGRFALAVRRLFANRAERDRGARG